MRAEIGIVVTQVRREAVDANVLSSVRAFDRYELPTFVGQCERIFEGARASEFHKFQAVTFPVLRASNSAR
jgi:hypothetical protein